MTDRGDDVSICIRGGRVIDPSQNLDEVTDLWINDGKIAGIGPQSLEATKTLEATGKIVCPGLIDMHVHFREPGGEADETIATGAASAVAGGVTSTACMPNTSPAIDSVETVELIYQRAREAEQSNVFPIGAISQYRAGEEPVDFEALTKAGAVAFTDDGSPVVNSQLMRRAMEICKDLDRCILSHSEDPTLSLNGVMNEGEVSRELGVQGYPALAEEIMIFREIGLAEMTGARAHILHVSSAVGVELIRRGKDRGVRITGEACPHHFTLTDESLRGRDTHFKMSPPLRTQKDIDAILEGLQDGTLDVLATDHAPHSPEKKSRPLETAPNGIIGLESFLPICIQALIETDMLTWPQMIEKMTINPARILSIDRGTLQVGKIADVTIIDPDEEWTISADAMQSKSRNCPFDGWQVKGRAQTVIIAGEETLTRPSNK